MVSIPIAIVGAGGMGGRHLRALGALYESGMSNVELVAVCDTREENAIHLADKAEEMLGSRPDIFTSMEVMKKKMRNQDHVIRQLQDQISQLQHGRSASGADGGRVARDTDRH